MEKGPTHFSIIIKFILHVKWFEEINSENILSYDSYKNLKISVLA